MLIFWQKYVASHRLSRSEVRSRISIWRSDGRIKLSPLSPGVLHPAWHVIHGNVRVSPIRPTSLSSSKRILIVECQSRWIEEDGCRELSMRFLLRQLVRQVAWRAKINGTASGGGVGASRIIIKWRETFFFPMCTTRSQSDRDLLRESWNYRASQGARIRFSVASASQPASHFLFASQLSFNFKHTAFDRRRDHWIMHRDLWIFLKYSNNSRAIFSDHLSIQLSTIQAWLPRAASTKENSLRAIQLNFCFLDSATREIYSSECLRFV